MAAMSNKRAHFFAGLLAASSILLIYPAPVGSQTADEVEKRIASLPADQRAYERFRFWNTMLPPDQQRGQNLEARYRDYLKSRGFADGDIDAQLRAVKEQGSRSEVERWNRILTAETPAFNVKPNQFLVEIAKGRKAGTALDVGMGQGRNAIWLAQQGWEVTGFDPPKRRSRWRRKPLGSCKCSSKQRSREWKSLISASVVGT